VRWRQTQGVCLCCVLVYCRPDITKIKAALGWEPKVPLREGLALMVEDFKKRLNVK
jgi:nucleoside-diphosphate-sugar epimerase